MLLHFITTEIKYLTPLIALFFFTEYTQYGYFTTVKMKSLTRLTKLFYFTTIKLKYLTTFTTLFYFTTIKMIYLTLLTTLLFFIDYSHYAVLLSLLLKCNL